jgi:hypothetical protein
MGEGVAVITPPSSEMEAPAGAMMSAKLKS